LDPKVVVALSFSSTLYLILGWSDCFLCLSTFYHYDEIPEKINLKRRKIYIICLLWRFQCIITWPHCLWAYEGPKVHHGRSTWQRKLFTLSQEAKEKQELAKSAYVLQDTPSMTS
jgi:hypothetical protein